MLCLFFYFLFIKSICLRLVPDCFIIGIRLLLGFYATVKFIFALCAGGNKNAEGI